MKVFYKYFAIPFLIAVIASVLYILDSFIAPLFVEGASFMWVAFAIWTIFYGATVSDRIRGFIGIVLGFLTAVIMMLITSSFSVNILTVSLSCLLGVFVMNFAVMLLDHTKKFWTNSVTGVFAGIALTFSGFGIGMSPIQNFSGSLTMLAILCIYAVFGLLCGFFSIYYTKKIKEQLPSEETKTKD